MLKLFKNKSYTLLFVGGLVSEIGSTLYIFAIGLFILDVTGSSLQMGTFMAVSLIIRVFVSPFAGVLVDRWNRVKVIYITDYIRGIALLFVGLYIFSGVTDIETIRALYVAAVILSLAGSFFNPALGSALPDIVGNENLQSANAAVSLVGAVQGIFGLFLGAIIYTLLGVEWVIIINAVSFIVSGFSEMFIKQKYKKIKTVEEVEKANLERKNSSFINELKFGFKYILKKPGLLALVLYSLVLNFAFSPMFSNGIPYLFRVDLEREAMDLASTQIAFSIAMVIGSIVVGSIKFKKISKVISIGIITLSTSFALVALLSHLVINDYISFSLFYWLFITNMVFLAFTLILVNVPLSTAMVKSIDSDVRGRVLSVTSSFSSGAVPIALLIGGFIIDQYGITVLGIFCVLAMLIPTFGLAFDKSIISMLDSLEKKESKEVVETI